MKLIIFSLLLLLSVQNASGQDELSSKPKHRWVIGISPGRSALLAANAIDANSLKEINIPKSLTNDYRHPKSGWNFHSDVHYLITANFGLGAKYMMFTSSAQQNFTISTDDYTTPFYSFPPYHTGMLYLGFKERLYIQYAGPSVISQQWLNQKHRFQLAETLSAGYVYYRNEMRQVSTYPNRMIPNHLVESGTWGVCSGLSFNFFPQTWLSFGVKADMMFARLTYLHLSTKDLDKTSKLGKNDYEYLTRLDYSLAIRFHF